MIFFVKKLYAASISRNYAGACFTSIFAKLEATRGLYMTVPTAVQCTAGYSDEMCTLFASAKCKCRYIDREDSFSHEK